MNIEIILRTHDQSNVHGDRPRIINVPKADMVKKCALSLKNSIDQVKDHNITLTIWDDRSSKDTVNFLKNIGEVQNTPAPGNNASMKAVFNQAKNSSNDLIYCVEDDFLHYPEALAEMIEFYQLAKEKGIPQLAVYPYDELFSYGVVRPMEQCLVVHSKNRHWRTNHYTTGTILCPPSVFQDYWPKWDKFSDYGKDPTVCEDNTINLIWRHNVKLFSPLPSLAVHLCENKPPICNYMELWNNIGEK